MSQYAMFKHYCKNKQSEKIKESVTNKGLSRTDFAENSKNLHQATFEK